MLTVAHPFLLLLLPLPPLVWFLLPAYRESNPAMLSPFLDRLTALTGRAAAPGAVEHPHSPRGLFALSIIWCCLILALARPQRLEEPLILNKPTRNMLLAVDLSGSMETEDMKNADGLTVTRLETVKDVLGEFLRKREGDRVGLIFFGNAPFTQAPFTEDLEVCLQLLNEAQTRMAGPQTMIGDAIGKAVLMFEESVLDERVLILLTDGNDTGSLIPPVKAAELAADKGIVIHTIAMGDPKSVGEEKFDEETLKQMAKVTSGHYFHAGNREELNGVYDELDRLTPHQIESVSHRPVTDLFHWPLALCLTLTLGFYGVKMLKQLLRTGSE